MHPDVRNGLSPNIYNLKILTIAIVLWALLKSIIQLSLIPPVFDKNIYNRCDFPSFKRQKLVIVTILTGIRKYVIQ